jgi:hypothetical protein
MSKQPSFPILVSRLKYSVISFHLSSVSLLIHQPDFELSLSGFQILFTIDISFILLLNQRFPPTSSSLIQVPSLILSPAFLPIILNFVSIIVIINYYYLTHSNL